MPHTGLISRLTLPRIGVALVATGCYHAGMNGLTIKLDAAQMDWLKRQARTRGCSQALIVRDLIEGQRGAKGKTSLHVRMRDLCGSLNGSPDLSTRRLKGYGRD